MMLKIKKIEQLLKYLLTFDYYINVVTKWSLVKWNLFFILNFNLFDIERTSVNTYDKYLVYLIKEV